MNEWMKEVERSSSAHNLKGDGKEEIVEDMQVWILGYMDPKWRKETMDVGWWILGHKDPKWMKEMETWTI